MGQVRLAVLIDADNVDVRHAEAIFRHVASLGEPIIRRIYGNWASNKAGRWKNEIAQHALLDVQQRAYVAGKSAADIALVVDAMDLLHGRACEGFVVVSSDSDYARLALRIREAGLLVYGIGESKAPEAFRKTCTAFHTLKSSSSSTSPAVSQTTVKKKVEKPKEDLTEVKKSVAVPKPKVVVPKTSKKEAWVNEVRPLVRKIFEDCPVSDGGVSANEMEKRFSESHPIASYKQYSLKSFAEVVQAMKEYELRRVKGSPTQAKDQRVSLLKKRVSLLKK